MQILISHYFICHVNVSLLSSLGVRHCHADHGLAKPEPHILLLLVLRGNDRPELVLHDPRPRPVLASLRPRRPDGGQAGVSSVLSRENITALPVASVLSSAEFARFVLLLCEASGVFVRREPDDHLGVNHVPEGGGQHQPQQDVEADPQHTGLAQPGHAWVHRQDGHEAEVETLEECPGVELREDGGPGADVGEEEQHGDQQRARHTRGTQPWNKANVTKEKNQYTAEDHGYSLSLISI